MVMPGLVLEVIVTAFYCFLRSVINRHFGRHFVAAPGYDMCSSAAV
jgi:hypothetical protein